MPRTPAVLLGLFAAAVSDASPAVSPPLVRIWHLTDVHVDPWYTTGSDASKCYCETTAKCKVAGDHCEMAASPTLPTAARPYGSSEGNCATPQPLYESAVGFMRTTAPDAAAVYFTGDFAEAGASYACHGPTRIGNESEAQITSIIGWAWRALKAALPGPRVFGCFGNHDSSPGDVFFGPDGDQQGWLYGNVSELWAGDLADPGATASLRLGGYYATRLLPGLVVASLNINYWVGMNPEARSNGTSALDQFTWLETVLESAAAAGDKVHILGHQPPFDAASPAAPVWLPGQWARFTALLAKHRGTVAGMFFGHIHTDQFGVARECRNASGGRSWIETTGIKWCSGGGNYAPGNVFNTSVDGLCPTLDPAWDADAAAGKCEAVCAVAAECVGFTLYFNETTGRPHECCFRTGSTASKPPDPGSKTRCYEKPPQVVCDGPPVGVVLPGPSLTEGYPATNPSVRLLEFDARTFELVDTKTFVADLHAANSNGTSQPKWRLEYSFQDAFNVTNLSAEAIAGLVDRMASAGGDDVWDRYRGRGDGSIFCSEYDSRTALFPPLLPCQPCNSSCKAGVLATLNGTNVPP